MKYLSWQGTCVLLLGTLLLFLLFTGASKAQESSCGVAGTTCLFVGDFSPVSVSSTPFGATAVTAPSAPAFGALVYDDFITLEETARGKLRAALDFRTAISPYMGNVDFNTYVQKFDYEAGWSTVYAPTSTTLNETVDDNIKALREARDLYAYLAVYAPESRFRNDATYTDYCSNPENPDPVDPKNSGLVLDPVIDWCNFPARLRQSVREAANIRMIFGQQFMADALGLHFSGTDFVGGENAVRQEVAQFHAAQHQYAMAELALAETLTRTVGSGCYVADFFQQAEWSLLSRAAQNQATAQHQIATRQGYLNVEQNNEAVTHARAAAQNGFRQAANDGYLKLIGVAGLGAAAPTGTGCVQGERPDGQLVAEMALNLLETQRKMRESTDGRNIFGFDVTFTPARVFKTVPGSTDRGLLEEAKAAATLAQTLQQVEINNSRAYDEAQNELLNEVNEIRKKIDTQLADASGCSNNNNDAAWYGCIKQHVVQLNQCLSLVDIAQGVSDTAFDHCMDKVGNSAAKRALIDLRSVELEWQRIYKTMANINLRIQNSEDRNVTVRNWLLFSGTAETAARVSQATFDMCSSFDFTKDAGTGALNTTVAIAGAANIIAQGVAGAISTAADVNIENAEHHREVQDLLLDESELLIEAYAALQQYRAKYAEFEALVEGIQGDLIEAQRQRAYFQHSPANDPSFRIVRDSSRIAFAKQMEYAARVSYLAARRAEYEYAARLSASNFRISDIYRARTAEDILRYLNQLESVTDSLAGGITDVNLNAVDFNISVAQHLLNLTDEELAKEGYTTPATAQAERVRRFRAWVADHSTPNTFEPPYDDKPVLKFSFTTSLLNGGIFSRVNQQGYDRYWLLKVAGIGTPKPGNNGMSINLQTTQPALSFQTVAMMQGGLVHLRNQAGCTFDYRLIAPAALLGLEWPENQPPENATAVFNANVNGTHAITENGYRSPAFLGRAVSSTDWEILVFAGAPTAGMSDMDLQQLTDIELTFSTTYASREPGTPNISECTRIDW